MNHPVLPAPRKPAVLYVAQAVALLSFISYALDALGALTLFGDLSIMTLIRTVGLAALIALLSFRTWRGIGRLRMFTRRQLLNYLWVMVFIYPVINVLRSFEMYAPAPHLEATQLSGAALAEVMRYGVFLGLIAWVGLSRGAKAYLGPPDTVAPVLVESDAPPRTEPSWVKRDDGTKRF